MNKSTLIVGALVISYVFYIAAKGELPTYFGLFYGPVTPGQPITTATAGPGTIEISPGVFQNVGTSPYLGDAADPSTANPLFVPGTSDILSSGSGSMSGTGLDTAGVDELN